MQISIELGNLWEALSAVGTVGATIVALRLARKDAIKRLDVLFIWDAVEHYRPFLLLSNLGTIPIAISKITFFYDKEVICEYNVLDDFRADYCGEYLIKGGEIKKKVFNASDFKFENSKKSSKKLGNLKIIVQDMSGKKYIYRQKMERDKLLEIFFGVGAFADINTL